MELLVIHQSISKHADQLRSQLSRRVRLESVEKRREAPLLYRSEGCCAPESKAERDLSEKVHSYREKRWGDLHFQPDDIYRHYSHVIDGLTVLIAEVQW